jgi:aryl-alcohol dehydrogenase-like predicted oxidoreductase
VVEHVEALRRDLSGVATDGAGSLPQVALRFCLSTPAVSTVIPGMRSVRNVEANCAAADAGPLPANVLAILKRHAWDRDFYAG